GRRGGRRRRGGPEDGLVGSIADELGPTPVSEASEAVADFDGVTAAPQQYAAPVETVTTYSEPQPDPQQNRHDAVPMFAPVEPAPAAHAPEPAPAAPAPAPVQEVASQDDDKAAARRRSTVREKVSFASAEPQPAPTPVAAAPQPAPAPAAAPAASTDTQPRKAGWWSRAFGNGE
ncbi:MAG TPA: ribonuclease E/G, partial [Tardiphaga sp.]